MVRDKLMLSKLNSLRNKEEMLPNVYKPSLVQIRPQFFDTDNSKLHEMVTWWQGTFGVGLNNVQLTAWQTAFDNAMVNCVNAYAITGLHYFGSIITDWSSSTGLSQLDAGINLGGGTYSVATPSQVCILQSLHIALRYKGGHGRMYWPMPGSNAAITDTPNATAVSNLTTEYAALVTAMLALSGGNGGPANQVVYRHRNNAALAATNVVLNSTVQPNLYATQRRRIRKVAHH
jgi:hypothetical protein